MQEIYLNYQLPVHGNYILAVKHPNKQCTELKHNKTVI